MKSILARPLLFGVLGGLLLSGGLICSTMLVTQTWLRIHESQIISVTGSARKNIRSDLVVWRGSFFVEAATLLEAQKALKSDAGKIEQFLTAKGVTNFHISPISIQPLRSSSKDLPVENVSRTVGYRLAQNVEVRSPDVDGTMRLERDSTALVEAGVTFTPVSMEFIYTGAAEAKVEMLAEATKDARARAEQIAAQGSRVIKELRSAKMGVFQIAPAYSTQTTWEGMNDTTALDKTITAVVTASFALK